MNYQHWVRTQEKKFRNNHYANQKETENMCYYSEQAEQEELEQSLATLADFMQTRVPQAQTVAVKYGCTEDILNGKIWVDGSGQVHDVPTMDKDHLRNVLRFVYNRRDSYWFGCRDATLIEQFENGEDFFQRVVRKSVFWKTAIANLTEVQTAGFNFDWE